MLEFTIPILPITVRQDSDKKMQRYEVPGIELDFVPGCDLGRKEFTGVFVAGGKDGIALSFCSEVPGMGRKDSLARDTATDPNYKSWVFNSHCVEFFIQPESSDVYYGWELSIAGSCLDYRVAVGAGAGILEGTCAGLSNPAAGVLMSEIAGQKLFFDYDWKSHASWKSEVDEEFWYLELFIPWSDFGLANTMENPVTPATGSRWRGTINRVIPLATSSQPVPFDGESERQALQSLLDFEERGEIVPRFHQPELFAGFQWQKMERS